MIDLLRLTNDVFDDASLSDPKLRTFAHDHLHRLTQLDTSGTFAPLIAATSTAYSAYYGNLTSEATAEAIGEGNTIATRNARAAVLKKLATQRHLVSFSFGQNGSVYQEFFPQGINAYRKASLDDLSTLLKRYETAALAHLSPAEASQVQTLITAYTNARKDQLTTTSETDKQRTSRREHRKTLTLQLTRNVLTIASHFLGKPDAFDDFFDLRLLPKRRAKQKPKTT
jgi:hypothetical protein